MASEAVLSQIGYAYTAGDMATVNSLIAANGVTPQELVQRFNASAAGVEAAYNNGIQFSTGPGVTGTNVAPAAVASEPLRDQLGNAYAAGNFVEVNRLIAANGLTAAMVRAAYNLDDAAMARGAAAGVKFAQPVNPLLLAAAAVAAALFLG